jgi:choline dehydrogenase-like flavoprotein
MTAQQGWDVVIVGTGVAGATLATELLRADPSTSILMLEAGFRVPMKDRRLWWDYIVARRTGWKPYDACEDRDADNPSVGGTPWHSRGSRAIIYGGATVHWGGWSLRFKPEDFHLFSNTGRGCDWPYSYETLEPFYCRAEELLSVCGDGEDPWRSRPFPLPPYPFTPADGEMIEALGRMGLSANAMPLARHRRCMATGSCKYCPLGARYTASDVMDALLADPAHVNLEVLVGAPATRLIAADGRRVNAVEYLDPQDGTPRKASADRVILCSGAYEVPKILMASTSDRHPHGLGNDTDLVGRFPVSHPFLAVTGTAPTNPDGLTAQYDFPSVMTRAWDTPETQADGKLFVMRDAMYPDTDLAGMMIEGRSRDEILAAVHGPRQVQVSAFMEEFGRRENRFSIAPGTTRFCLPRTRIDFTEQPDFRRRAFANLDRMTTLVREMGYEVDTSVAPNASGPYLNEIGRMIGTQDGHHTCSTARMGRDETEGVVDADLKVFGTDNLWVCSNAVLPNCAAVNPTLTLVAVALKLADHLVAATGDRAAVSAEAGV